LALNTVNLATGVPVRYQKKKFLSPAIERSERKCGATKSQEAAKIEGQLGTQWRWWRYFFNSVATRRMQLRGLTVMYDLMVPATENPSVKCLS